MAWSDSGDKRMFLLVDDEREYMNMDFVARSYRAAIPILRDEPISHLLIDNDLGGKREGYNVLEWARDHNRMPSHVFVVSANPVARDKMAALLTHDMKYTQTPQGWWLSPDWKLGDP